ncbi:8-oxo-dGTP diphosphatase [Marinobacter litoralis]|uniref:8-oxo-dGTP diphosphatase n=1 Tax=Marinobacter litoralis TaxID=187981 RepID=A0A3M2RJ79_9GAMM|nr:Nudix family hydrolase [Marinobacter litoralis]RMJ05371.1 8-oxo-dGTP diphosphatase [Marinobacter litoralis]
MPNTAANRLSVPKQVHVAVAVIIRNGRVLIARRPDHVHQGGLLEFPGGKVEQGESVQQALVREIEEETGLTVPLESLQPVIGIRHDYGDKQVFLDVWKTSAAKGEPEGREGQPIDWMRPDALQDEDFPAANRPIIRALSLPGNLPITGAMASWENGRDRFVAALPSLKSGLVVLRAPELPAHDYRQLAQAVLAESEGSGVGVLLHGCPDLAAEFPEAAGVHLPWREAEGLPERPVPVNRLLGVSCHSADQLRQAERLGADYAVFGPVLPTASHPGEPGLGWEEFERQVSMAVVPVYGLGGLALEHQTQAQACGGQGVAGISFWWPSHDDR